MQLKSFPKTDSRTKLLAALFSKASEFGVEAGDIRQTIAPSVIGKRLSEASSQEIFKVIERLVSLYRKDVYKKYPSSKAGCVAELEAVAEERWGDNYIKPLNAFVSHNRPAKTHYKWLKVGELKAIKERLCELNLKDGR